MLNILLVTDPAVLVLNQLTGIHLSQEVSSLSGHTSSYMVKHQICARVDHRLSAITSTRCASQHAPL